MVTRSNNSTVFNQSPPFADINLFTNDRLLLEAVSANGATSEVEALSAFGARWGSARMLEQARIANENPPKLRAFDANGNRCDVVEYHPAYHFFMAESIREGLQASTWLSDGTAAAAPAEAVRAARYVMVAQVENGHMCPITMTRAAVPALAAEPDLFAQVMPKIASRTYDPTFRPWWEKAGITVGMGMTEKQGGTDVRANTTTAVPADEGYRLDGHKWFMSAPMCDAFLVLAQAPGGLTCFWLPRFTPDGQVNGLHFQRLKDKLGNRSNASTEVELSDAYAIRIGDEGRGIQAIMRMVQLTRLDCAISSAGMMRMALAQAVHHCRYRTAFQKRLIDQPLMRTVLADMALELEGALAAVMRLCSAFDRSALSELDAVRTRLLTPAVKYAVCKTAPAFAYEAMECLGGNGYVEEGMLARLYREAPVNAIWEGSGNVVCLDVLRVFARNKDGARAVINDVAREAADCSGAAEAASAVVRILSDPTGESDLRLAVELLARLAATAALNQSAPGGIADLYARSRLGGQRGATFGAAQLANNEVTTLLDRTLAPT
ncbi:MAG: DNA alkylation response protein [Rhizobiales bacterium]|nr:DNA alkylation response protein [Hyphomicrobiales bacterium]